jgi:hypothetical protein
MNTDVQFSTVLVYLEGRGWVLKRIDKPYRVFVRRPDELPVLVEVSRDKTVDRDQFEYIKTIAG